MRVTMGLLAVTLIVPVGWADASEPPAKNDAAPEKSGLVAQCQSVQTPIVAASACTKAIESGKWRGAALAWAWNNLGLARAAQSDWLAALKAYDAALKLDADYAAAFSNRGNVHAALGDMLQALADHDRAVELDPNYVAALHNRAVDHEELGNHKAALRDYRAVLKLDPGHAAAHVGLATASCKLGRIKASAEARLRAIARGHLDAVAMQKVLQRAGYYRGPIDGIFGKGSRAALRVWTRKGCLAPA